MELNEARVSPPYLMNIMILYYKSCLNLRDPPPFHKLIWKCESVHTRLHQQLFHFLNFNLKILVSILFLLCTHEIYISFLSRSVYSH